jgi:hypothetical protein
MREVEERVQVWKERQGEMKRESMDADGLLTYIVYSVNGHV